MSDLAALAVAAAAWFAALLAWPAPRWIGLTVTGIALVTRRAPVLVAGVALLASSLSAAAWSGLEPPAAARAIAGDVVLVGDPVRFGPSVRVDVRVGGRRVEAWARGPAADAIDGRLAGEVVHVEGRLRAPPPDARARLAVRHVVARLDVTHVGAWQPGALAHRAANALRRILERGGEALPPTRAALLRGFLLGDDRDIPTVVAADFRAAGLTHLLAVSGSNVAFVLAAAGPLLRRVALRGRLVLSIGLLALFVVLTRAEPSVLRASAMAAIACWAAFAGRPLSRLRVVALAVTALVLVDPLLVHSVGFQLSVGASIGLVLLAGRLARLLPGPRWLADAVAVTVAAQVGVAPVVLTTFDGVPAVSILANVLAVPVAAPLTAWGMTAGMAAGVLGGAPATVLHLPTSVMVAWVSGVATTCARLPLGAIGTRHVVVGVLVALGVLAARRRARWAAAGCVAIAVAATIVQARASPRVSVDELARGAQLWRGGASVLVLAREADPGRVLDGLRAAGVRRVDLVVARRGTVGVAGTLLEVRRRISVRRIAAPPDHRIRGATAVAVPLTLRMGRLDIHLSPRGDVLEVVIGETARDAGAARGRGP